MMIHSPDAIPRPGLALGCYPERGADTTSRLDRYCMRFADRMATRWQFNSRSMDRLVAAVDLSGHSIKTLSSEALRDVLDELRVKLTYQGWDDDLAVETFALVREMSGRVLGMRHYDSQIIGGWAIYQGKLAEMQTGEGKTLTAVLPAACAALAGIPVHIITANDYLASRDAMLMRPLYESLGISVGVINESMDFKMRQRAYACDVTYCTNKQVCFDYLRDRVERGADGSGLKLNIDRLYRDTQQRKNLMLRGLCFAIIDEADSVLIDEAKTPLILSTEQDDDQCMQPVYSEALELAVQLQQGIDYFVNYRERRISLSEHTVSRVTKMASSLSNIWAAPRQCEELIQQALSAQHLFLRDREYIVRDNKIRIVDVSTGRVMADRTWEFGLQQMVEAKEHCPLTGQMQTLARISYQRFFRRYIKLSGMTGTAQEVESELGQVYGLSVTKIAPHRYCQRVAAFDSTYSHANDAHCAIVASAINQSSLGRPVLIGTRTVEVAELLAQKLSSQGVDVQVLNARQDEQEAKVIAQAGLAGKITVATNMAGRGTDIHLGPDVESNGGLHVILTERNDSARIDRQLVGRCARQGQPGSFQRITSLEDELIKTSYGVFIIKLTALFARSSSRELPGFIARSMLGIAQYRTEQRHERLRRLVEQEDERLDSVMSFAGAPE